VRSRLRTGIVIAFCLASIAGTATVASVPSLRWRAQLVVLVALGKIPEVDWRDVREFVRPGSSGYNDLARLIITRNPHPVVLNPFIAPQDRQTGQQLYSERCAACHGVNGGGGAAPALAGLELKRGSSDWSVYHAVRKGLSGTGMQPQNLTFEQSWQVVGYVRSLEANGSPPEQTARTRPAANLPYQAIKDLKRTGEEWLTFSGTYSSQRHSALAQIERANVAELSVAWVHQFDGQPPKIQASPLVRDGVMFTTVPIGHVHALDARTGKRLWKYTHQHESNAAGGEFGVAVNRGVALLGNKVFLGTGDARLVALDSGTGKLVWSAAVDRPDVYYISAAPLAFKDLVVTGVGTRQIGRGFVAAYDAETGRERWRFMTIPEPGKAGNETWSDDSWRNGGAPTWMTGSYDVERDMLIWGVGNPKPDYDAEVRRGDNLHSNSAIALRGTTGELLWHFQFTPHDDKDWDANQIPLLVDLPAGNGAKPHVLWANRNGFYYVLDRLTGRYITSKPFVHQTWTGPMSEQGRPQPLPRSQYNKTGQLMFPGNQGGTNWWPPTYNPDLNLVYVPVLEQGMLFYPAAQSWPRDTGKSSYTAVRALNPATGDLVWEMRNAPRYRDAEIGGLLSTASGLLFGSDQSTFFALDAKTGQALWSIETGGKISAAPITYMLDGVQYIAINAGRDLIAFALARKLAARFRDPAVRSEAASRQ
jgi:alcohol dehydrogenase (cytochrome c)